MAADKQVMAIAPEVYAPLLRWTQALTAGQRALERRHDVETQFANLDVAAAMRQPPGPRPRVREDRYPSHPSVKGWMALLPADVVDCCPWCVLPSRGAKLCGGCRILQQAFGAPLNTLEFLCCADVETPPESFIYTWKQGTGLHDHPQLGAAYAGTAVSIAAPLSGYLEAHATRLLGDDPVVTAVPSRAPLIAATMTAARDLGWFACHVHVSGSKRGAWAQHLATDQAERRSRTEHDWDVDGDVVRGRDVVLVDDVFVTGTSLFSYASALKTAGARTIRAIVIGRHINQRYPHYTDAFIIARRTRDLTWTPDRSHVAGITT